MPPLHSITTMKKQNFLPGLGLIGIAALLLPACGPSAGHATAGLPGTIGDNADGTHFVIETNESGESSTMHITSVSFGRLIDEVYDASGTTPVHRQLVIGQDIESDGVDYLIETNSVSRVTRLTILHDFGTTSYDTAFAKLFLGMDDLLTKDLSPSTLPPYSTIPRNAAIVVRFSDLIDETTISQDTVRLLTGYGPTSPFTTRMFADPNFGAEIGGAFHSTRLVLDPVVTAAESQATGLPVNSLGLPGAINTSMPNLALRIPTTPDFASGQFSLLSNLVGNPLTGAGNAPFDYNSPTLDAVRALRTGGLTEKVGDPNNGFLPDGELPEVIGRQSVTVTGVLPDTGTDNYLVDLTFSNINCADAPKVGDILEQPGVFAEVTAAGGAPVLGVVSGVKMHLLTPGSGVPFPGGGDYETPWDPTGVVGADCFVEFDPPAGAGTNLDVDPYANVIVRFSEPMDPELMTPFDSFVIGRNTTALEDMGVREFVVGEVAASSDLREFRFVQTAPFRHTLGSATDDFFINLFGQEGVVDLAGNGLANPFPQVPFFIDPNAPTHKTDHRSFRFATYTDVPGLGNIVDDFQNGSADIRGQFVADTQRGTISPRPVDRFSQTIDRNQGVPNWMVANASTLTGGLLGTVQEPLNPLGCKLMNLWRYFDMGLDAADEAFFNIDVEHVNWAPIGSNVIAEYYPEFQISMTTTSRMPDETWITPPNTLVFPNSGLIATSYDENVLSDPHNEVKVVHDRSDGYFLDPVDKFKSTSQTFMFPFPMNRDIPAEDFKYWTFRDTAITTRGGSDPLIGIEPPVRYDLSVLSDGATLIGFGAGDLILDTAATPPIQNNLIVPDGNFIPSFGLPILTEYRCYSSDDAIGVNRLDTSLAMAPAWTVGVIPSTALAALPKQPFTRLFSAGGYNAASEKIYRDPDLEVAPSGGFNYETAVAPKGTPTVGADNVYYMGQLDFVIRVSRVYTHWHKVADANPVYFEPVLEPRNDQQPEGTSVNLDFRGAQNLTSNPPQGDALTLNAYGDIPGGGDPEIFDDPAGDNGPLSNLTDWTSDITDLNGLVFYQVRITFINNAATGTFPELSTLALAQESL